MSTDAHAEHDEVERDALREVTRAAQAADPGIMPLGDLVSPLYPYGQRERETRAPVDKAVALEDLYAQYPVGDGTYLIRVERDYPTKWQGIATSGHLEDLQYPITMNDFKARYGGGTYTVRVLGYEARPGSGEPMLRVKSSIKFPVPGAPNLTTPTAGGESMSMQGSVGGNSHPNVEIKRLEMEMMRDQQQQKMTPETMRLATEMATERAQEVRETMNEQIASLRLDVGRLNVEASKREERIRALQEELLQVRSETERKISTEDMRRVTELRATFDSERQRIQDKHADDMSRLRDESSRQIAEARRSADDNIAAITRRNDEDRKAMAERMDSERAQWNTRLSDETRRMESAHAAQIAQMQQMYEIRLGEVGRTAEARIADLTRAHDQELRSIQTNYTTQIEAIRSMESGRASNAEAQARFAVEAMTRQIADLRGELKGAKADASALQAKVNKPVLEAIQEAQALTALLGGDKEEAGEEKPADWKSVVADIAKGALPGMVAAFAQARPPQPAPQMQAQQLPPHMQQAQAQAMHQQQMAQQQAAQVPQRRRATRPASPWGDFSSDAGLPPPPDRPMAPQPRRQTAMPVGAASMQTQPVIAPGAGAPMPGTQVEQQVPQAPQPPPQQQQVAPTEAQQMQVGQEQFIAFITHLEQTIKAKEKPPEVFAAEFIQSVGLENAKAIVAAYDPSQLIDMITVLPQGNESPLVTFTGRQYLTSLWRIVAAS